MEADLSLDRVGGVCNNNNMNRTTVVADNALLVHARSLARKRGVSFSEFVRCALVDYMARVEAKAPKPSFVGAGASGGKLRLSERAEELLFEEGRGR